jgi:hypothetical protein
MKGKLVLQSKRKYLVGVGYIATHQFGYIGTDQLTDDITKWYCSNSSEKYAKLHLILKKIIFFSLIDNDTEILSCYAA